MSVYVKIEPKGLFKKKLTIEEIATLKNLSYGVPNENYVLSPDKIGEHTLLYDPNDLARGIEIWLENKDINLSLSLPTTEKEIELFYDLIQKICKTLKTNHFLREEERVSPSDIERFITYDEEASRNALIEMQNKLATDEYKNFEIFGIMNPISIGSQEATEINGSLEQFATFLNRLQQIDAYYASPKVYQKKDETLFGIYFIGEEIVSIIPKKPYIIMNQIPNVNNWYVFLPGNHYISYQDFIEHITPINTYDANHVIISLSKKEIDQLIEKFQTEI